MWTMEAPNYWRPTDFGCRMRGRASALSCRMILAQRLSPLAELDALIFMRGPRAAHPSIAPVSQAEMTARLLSESGQGPLSDSETVAVICGLAAGASCFALTPGPLGETADAVAAVLTALKHPAG